MLLSSVAFFVPTASSISRRLAIFLLCLKLAYIPLGAAAEERGGLPQSPGEQDPTSSVKNAIRHPGSATTRQGGVGPTSRPILPPGTGSVRSPGMAKAVPPAASQNQRTSKTDLNGMQGPVLERINYHRAIAGLAPVTAEPRLLRAAQFHTQYLGSTDEMGHYENRKTNLYYTEHSPFDRIDAEHYDYSEAGEVVALQLVTSTRDSRCAHAVTHAPQRSRNANARGSLDPPLAAGTILYLSVGFLRISRRHRSGQNLAVYN